jgi:hypothetical protein
MQIEHDAIHAGRAMLGSTLHWKPLLNGHSGYAPRSYPFLRQAGQALPSQEGFARLEALVGVRYVIVHRDEIAPAERAAWMRAASEGRLVERAAHGPHVLFEVAEWTETGRYREAIASTETRPETLAGWSREPLPPDAQRGALSVAVDTPFRFAGRRRLPQDVSVELRNDGDRTWPGLDPDPEGLVRLRARFVDEHGEALSDDTYALLTDVPPGTTTQSVPIAGPAREGRYGLRVELVQQLGDQSRSLAVAPFTLPVEVRSGPRP